MMDIITGRAPPPARAESYLSKGSQELAWLRHAGQTQNLRRNGPRARTNTSDWLKKKAGSEHALAAGRTEHLAGQVDAGAVVDRGAPPPAHRAVATPPAARHDWDARGVDRRQRPRLCRLARPDTALVSAALLEIRCGGIGATAHAAQPTGEGARGLAILSHPRDAPDHARWAVRRAPSASPSSLGVD